MLFESIMKEKLLMIFFEEQEKKKYLMDVINREMKINVMREKFEIKYNVVVKVKEFEVKI